jgi:sphingosine kinase
LRVRLAGDVHQLGQHRRLEIHSLIEKGSNLRLSKMHVLVEPINGPDAEQWVDMAMSAAYGGEFGSATTSSGSVLRETADIKPFRRVLLLVNPFGGKGKAKSICKETALPILEGAGCKLDVKGVCGVFSAEVIAATLSIT